MEVPAEWDLTLDPAYIQDTLIDSHWDLDGQWLVEVGITSIPGRYDLPDSSSIEIDDLWEYMQSLYDVFPEPDYLMLHIDQYGTQMQPILQLIPRMTSLTALHLDWVYNEAEEWEQIEAVRWLNAFSTFQLNQLKYVSLGLTHCQMSTADLFDFLEPMSQLQSLKIQNMNVPPTWQLLCLPPLPELRQLMIFLTPITPFQLPVLPALTKLNLHGGGDDSWFPNLSAMTSLESLSWNNFVNSHLVSLTQFLPPQIENIYMYGNLQPVLSDVELNALWTNMMKLTRLTKLKWVGISIPPFFVDWLKTSQVGALFGSVFCNQPDLAPLFAASLPKMKHLRSLECVSGEWEWMAPVIQECTQLTRLLVHVMPPQMSLLVPTLKNLHQLETLHIFSMEECVTPRAFYALSFPHLTSLMMEGIVESDVPDLADFLARHGSLTGLSLRFVSATAFEASWSSIVSCPLLEELTIIDMNVEDSFKLPSLPPTLRELDWRGKGEATMLPAHHLLTSFRDVQFDNNVVRHVTLVELHFNWLDSFWN